MNLNLNTLSIMKTITKKLLTSTSTTSLSLKVNPSVTYYHLKINKLTLMFTNKIINKNFSPTITFNTNLTTLIFSVLHSQNSILINCTNNFFFLVLKTLTYIIKLNHMVRFQRCTTIYSSSQLIIIPFNMIRTILYTHYTLSLSYIPMGVFLVTINNKISSLSYTQNFTMISPTKFYQKFIPKYYFFLSYDFIKILMYLQPRINNYNVKLIPTYNNNKVLLSIHNCLIVSNNSRKLLINFNDLYPSLTYYKVCLSTINLLLMFNLLLSKSSLSAISCSIKFYPLYLTISFNSVTNTVYTITFRINTIIKSSLIVNFPSLVLYDYLNKTLGKVLYFYINQSTSSLFLSTNNILDSFLIVHQVIQTYTHYY